MRKTLLLVLCLVFVFTLVVPVSAQDDAMSDKIVCDSTVITLLLVAENNFGFHSMMDVSQFEKGQFAPLFESMMAMMDDMAGDEMMEEEAMMEESMAEDAMMDDMMVTLEPGNIEGEPAECGELRAEIEGYLYDTLSMELGMMEESM